MNAFVKLKFPATKVRANLHLKEIKKHLDLEFTPQGNKKTFGFRVYRTRMRVGRYYVWVYKRDTTCSFNTDETY